MVSEDPVARARIDAHEAHCRERLKEMRDIVAEIWKAIDALRGKLFKAMAWGLAAMFAIVLSLIGYIWSKGIGP